MKLFRILLSAALLLVTGAFASAQEQKSPEQQEKEMYAMIEKEVEQNAD